MKELLKKIFIVSAIAFISILIGQLHWNGRPLAHYVSALVHQPPSYEIVHDTNANIISLWKDVEKKVPVVIAKTRQKIAVWLYPSVIETHQPQRN